MPVSSPPHGLELIIDFVNTYDVETDVDELGTPAGAAAWLADRELLARDAAVGASERRHAIRLREALRALMLEHNGLTAEDADAGELERAAQKGRLAVHFGRD